MPLKNRFSIYNLTVPQLLLILGGIIFLTPLIFTLNAHLGFWDFSKTGQIGDTLGGITAPFISSFAAVLVFVAFKEQVRANELIKQQQYIQSIETIITKLEERSMELRAQMNSIQESIRVSSNLRSNYSNGLQKRFSFDQQSGLEILYSSILFKLCNDMIKNLETSERHQFFKRIGLLFSIKYSNSFDELYNTLEGLKNMESNDEGLVDDLLKQLKNLESFYFVTE